MHEKLLRLIEERNLVSVMNNTKWNKFGIEICSESKFEPFVRIKDLLSQEPSGFALMDWTFSEFNPARVEWVDIDPVKREYLGKLIPDKETDISGYIKKALIQSNTPYSIEGKYFRIWGYHEPTKIPRFM